MTRGRKSKPNHRSCWANVFKIRGIRNARSCWWFLHNIYLANRRWFINASPINTQQKGLFKLYLSVGRSMTSIKERSRCSQELCWGTISSPECPCVYSCVFEGIGFPKKSIYQNPTAGGMKFDSCSFKKGGVCGFRPGPLVLLYESQST